MEILTIIGYFVVVVIFVLSGIILGKVNKIMATIADLQNKVAELTTVDQSVVALLDGLSQQLKDAIAQNDPAAIQKVIDDLDAQKTALADAVTRNTAPPTA